MIFIYPGKVLIDFSWETHLVSGFVLMKLWSSYVLIQPEALEYDVLLHFGKHP